MVVVKLNTKAGFDYIYQVMQYNGYNDVIDAIIDIVDARNKYVDDLITEAEVIKAKLFEAKAISAEIEEMMPVLGIILSTGRLE